MVPGAALADGADDVGEMLRAAIGEIVAVDRGDDDMREAHAARPRRRRCSGSSASSGPGRPVLTLQKAQARVQVSPMIMKVACFFDQHSPIFGQPASSQTVTSLLLAHDGAGLSIDGDPGAFTRIQSGLRSMARPAGAPFQDAVAAPRLVQDSDHRVSYARP